MKWINIVLGSVFLIIIAICISFLINQPINENNNSSNYTEPNTETSNEIKWDHMPITYRYIDTEEFISTCKDYIKERIDRAFNEITNATAGVVSFRRLNEQESREDIAINCSNKVEVQDAEVGTSTAGLAGPQTIRNKIVHGQITFYPYRNCGTYPDTELHEILHIFGFEHNETNRLSLMYPAILKCDGKLDNYIREELIRIYG